jgi:hypothetical protein
MESERESVARLFLLGDVGERGEALGGEDGLNTGSWLIRLVWVWVLICGSGSGRSSLKPRR